MPGIPLGQSAFERAQMPPVTLKNMFYERAPTNLEDQVSLVPRGRLSQFATAGAGPIRGLYRQGGVMATSAHSGAIIALSGSEVYRVDQNTAVATLIGTVTPNDLRMSAEGNVNVVMFTIGAGLYTTDGNTVSAVTFPSSFAVSAVDTLNNYFIVASELGRFYWSAVGGTTFDALDFATAESKPDVLLSLKVIGDELWLFGRLSVEVWQPTGDLDLPFQRIGGRIFGIGITARDTCQKLNVDGIDTVCWVGTDRRVYRTNPNPTRISDASIEDKLARSTVALGVNALNPYATTVSSDGHDFYVLHIPGEGSWAYDLGTGKWDEWDSYSHDHFRGAVSCVGVNSQPLLGDDTSNVIWQMTKSVSLDGADPVVFEFTGLLEVPGAPQRCGNVMVDCGVGTTTDPEADPMIQMSISDDGGEAFDEWQDAPLGRQGERNNRVMWGRQGLLKWPGRVFRWRTTEPVTVTGASYNESMRR